MTKKNIDFEGIRNFKGVTQKQFADHLNRDQSAVSKLENGITQLKFSDLEEFAKLVDMPIVDIITYPEKYVPENKNKDYPENNIKRIVNEPSGYCALCKAKDKMITELQGDKEFLKQQLKYYQDKSKAVRSG